MAQEELYETIKESVQKEDIKFIQENLLKLPTNYMNSKKYAELPLKDVLDMEHKRTLSIRTINDKYLGFRRQNREIWRGRKIFCIKGV